MNEEQKLLLSRIVSGEIDINDRENFFIALYKGFLWSINDKLSVRGNKIPHIVVNTGDDTMYLNVKGQNHSIEPAQVSNEDYVYSVVPRATVQFSGINMKTDQLTSPHTRGKLSLEYGDMLYSMTAKFRRIPITTSANVKYYLDNFTDLLECSQQIIANTAFINNFRVTYMGQTINCTYRLPDSFSDEKMLEFDGVTVDSKNRTVEIEYELETNLPVYDCRTAVFEDCVITNHIQNVSVGESPVRPKKESTENKEDADI